VPTVGGAAEEPGLDDADAGRHRHPASDEAIAEAIEAGIDEGQPRRRIVLRALLLAVTGISLYLLAPSLLEVLSSWDELADLHPAFLLLCLVSEAASFVCLWFLLRIALDTTEWFSVATSQLASNAFSKIVPGGGPAGAALQFRMLSTAGFETGSSASAVTAVTLLMTALPFAMPVLALPAILTGTPVDRGLAQAAWLGVAVFVVLALVAGLLLTTDRLLRAAGALAQRLRNALLRHRPPLTELPDRLVRERNVIRQVLGDHLGSALAAAFGRVVFDYAALLVAVRAVDPDPRPSLVLLAYVANVALASIPITPGGLGFVEAGLTATLTLAGVPAAGAVVATLAYRLASYWIPLLAGAVAYPWFSRRFRTRAAAG